MAARIRHIALSVKDIDATADFYEKAFGLKRSPKSEGPTAYRVYMSDGELNLALLQYKSEVGSGLKNPSEFVGIHHFGFQCDDLEKQQKQIEKAGGKFFFDLGDPDDDDFERKFRDPNGIIFDVNWKGWALTSSKVKAKGKTKAKAKAKTKARPAGKTKLAAARKKVSKKTAKPAKAKSRKKK
jgi:catechol 2,3-dioxygenase-like lactoylglutathione lyase family enzyme